MSQDHQGRKAEDAAFRSAPRVGLFIDYENIRRSLEQGSAPPPAPQVICKKLCEMARRFGHVLTATAYADWSVSGPAAREFRRRHVEPRLVLAKESGEDSTIITLSLDALETLFVEPGIDVYLIASGNSDVHDLLERLRRRGKRVIVCAARADTGRELIRGADRFVPLEDLLGLRSTPPARQMEWETYDWTGFVRLIHNLDTKLNFVGLRYVATKVLNPHNCGLSDRGQKQDLLNRAIDLKIIDPYQVENIEEGGEPVSACRLNLDHPIVKEALHGEESDEPAPGQAPKSESERDPEREPAEPVSPPHPPRPRTYHSSVGGDDIGRPGESSD